VDPVVKAALADIVGTENVSDRLIDRVVYAYDGSTYHSKPDGAVWVSDTGQVSGVLAVASRHRVPVTARGAGTGMCGLAVPARGGIIVDLGRMNKILEIHVPDRLAVVQPGVVHADFQYALGKHGFFFPPDPASCQVCTLGGNAATNAGGLRGAKYGTTRDYVLGLEVVLASGEIMRTGARTMKSSSGYDLTRLFVGSEGTLGIITEITFKISPKPTHTATCLAYFDSLEKAAGAVTRVMQSDVSPSAMELLDGIVIKLLREHTELDLPVAQAMLLVETDGFSQQEVDRQARRVARLFTEKGASGLETACSAHDAERLWKARKSIGGVVGKLPFTFIAEDITVPLTRISDYLHRTMELSRSYNLTVFNFGHAGDGNFHTDILIDQSDPDQLKRAEQILEELHKSACELGGTLTGEHGIGITKAPYLHLEHDRVALRTMRIVKQGLDPLHILNPGKMGLD
jgi:glycolate oxidase